MEKLSNFASQFPILSQIEQKTKGKLRKEHSLLIIALLIILVIFSTPLGSILSSFISLLIPLRESLIVLKMVNPKVKDLKHLVIFFMVYTFFLFIDCYFSFITSFLPFYNIAKLALLLYLGPTNLNGGEFVYEKVLSKIPENLYEGQNVQEAMRRASEGVKKLSQEAMKMKDKGSKAVEEKISEKVDEKLKEQIDKKKNE